MLSRDFDKVEVGNPYADGAPVVSRKIGSVVSCNNESPLDDDISDNTDIDVYNNIANTLKKLANIKKKPRAHLSINKCWVPVQKLLAIRLQRKTLYQRK